MAFIRDASLDLTVQDLITNVTTLYITSQEAVSYAEASSTYALGNKASPTLGAVSAGTPSGRKTTVSAITDGSVTGDGTASHWALTDGTILYSTGALAATQPVTNGNTFTTDAFDVTVLDAVAE